uniref:GAF domain-containing protein n=1 Tax=Salmonella sp. SAL4359 TaxID=3159880 RepID=UPI00397B8DF9
GYTHVSLYLLQDGMLQLQHQVGYNHVIWRLPVAEGVMGRVARSGVAELLEDVHSDPVFVGAISGIVSEICVPLFDQSQVVGVLNVET